ncbi:hypothetical protein D3C87_2013200 [compost metagenome]
MLGHRLRFLQSLAFDRFGHHGGGGHADGAALSRKPGFLHNAVLHLQLQGNPVAAGGVMQVDRHTIILEMPPIAGVFIMIHNDPAV